MLRLNPALLNADELAREVTKRRVDEPFDAIQRKPKPMKNIVLCLLLAGAALGADLPKELTTNSGKNYKDVKVISSDPYTITISHAGGTNEIPSAELPPEWRKYFKLAAPQVALGESRIGETLEQCRARYSSEGVDTKEPGVKVFEKDGYIILCHFKEGKVDEIQYKHWLNGLTVDISFNEQQVLLSKSSHAWVDARVLVAGQKRWVSNDLVAEYDAGSHVLAIFTMKREEELASKKAADAQAAADAKLQAVKDRLKGL